jgi:hypothetical protein
MVSPLTPELQQLITRATEDLAEAEREFWGALALLHRGDRADKVLISASIETAANKVSAAKTALAALIAEQR